MSDHFPYLPEEIIQKILLGLPVKSLIKFNLVCKSWRSMIKSSSFIQSHLCSRINSDKKNDTNLLLLSAFKYEGSIWETRHHHWLNWDTPGFVGYSEFTNPRTPTRFPTLNVIGTHNGIICFETKPPFQGLRSPAFIWNPSIKRIVMLPEPPACFSSTEYAEHATHNFGYDSHSGDYKILRIVTLHDNDHKHLSRFATIVQIYSLAKGSWEILTADDIPQDLQSSGEPTTFLNGSLHLVQLRKSEGYINHGEEFPKFRGDQFIVSFDLSAEVFGEIMIPKALERGPCRISKYGECLALVSQKDFLCFGDPNCGCDIWVMQDYGVLESWTYMYKIPIAHTTIFGFKRSGEVLLKEINRQGRSRTLWYDPQSNQVEVFGSDEYMIHYFLDSFVESLVLLDHPNAIQEK